MSTKASGGAGRELTPLEWRLPEPVVIEHGVEGFAMWLRAFKEFNPEESARIAAQVSNA